MTTLTSAITTIYINPNYPVSGQDNDAQGFRDNFLAIKNNFATAKSEVEAILANTAVAPRITTIPLTSTSTGTTNQIAYTTGATGPYYLYVCVNTNTWVRANLSAW